MNSSRTSLRSRVAVGSMDLALRFWPESSREWGQAVLAEMGQISEPAAAMNWAAGGILLFGRAVVAHFFEWIRLPAGTGFSQPPLAGNGDGPHFPKHSRWATAAILVLALILFVLPKGQEAARTVGWSWRGNFFSPSDERELDKIAAKAAQEKDARGLAFVTIVHPDNRKAYGYADQAVDLDPSLAWVYGSRWYFTGQDPNQRIKRAERLQKFDHENGFVHLLSAHAIEEPLIEKQISDERSGIGTEGIRETLGSDAAWRNEMEKGFAAQKYDSYFQRNLELVQEGWRKYPDLPAALMGSAAWQHSIGGAPQLLIYADIRSKEAVQQGSAGNTKEAEKILSEVRDFGGSISRTSTFPFEKELGAGVTQRGLLGFEKLYAATGQAAKEKQIQAQLDELEATKKRQIDSYLAWREGVENSFHRKALLIQFAAFLCLLLGIAVLVSLVALETGSTFGWRRGGAWRWIACRVADYGPALFLLASVALVVSFQPLAQAFEQFRSKELTGYDGLGLFWQVFTLSDANWFAYFYEPYHQWLVGTLALALLALFVLVRGWSKGNTVTAVR